jgi:phosphohistidine phosphatase SixA
MKPGECPVVLRLQTIEAESTTEPLEEEVTPSPTPENEVRRLMCITAAHAVRTLTLVPHLPAVMVLASDDHDTSIPTVM